MTTGKPRNWWLHDQDDCAGAGKGRLVYTYLGVAKTLWKIWEVSLQLYTSFQIAVKEKENNFQLHIKNGLCYTKILFSSLLLFFWFTLSVPRARSQRVPSLLQLPKGALGLCSQTAALQVAWQTVFETDGVVGSRM